MKRAAAAWMLGAVVVAGALVPRDARACGGFFCSTQPIDQAGERIVFGVRDGQVEAHVNIQYEGEAQKFSWVVPVTALPQVSVGSPLLFRYLDGVTQARFSLTWQPNSCPFDNFGWPRTGAPEMSDGGGAPGGGGVTVVSTQEVGPYDVATLSATDATALRTWLADNGYVLTEAGGRALEPYVGRDYYFVAVKLQQDKQAGDLRPLVLKFAGQRPCIPIKLTAIAARPDMPIIAYVLADARAVPMNYRHVLINPTRVDWLSGGSNYAQVASAAVDEAGGRAFLTEFAGSARELASGFEGQTRGSFDTTGLASYTHPVDFADALLMRGFGQDPAVQGLLRKYIPMPAALVSQGVTEQQFYNALGAYRSAIDQDPDRPTFDAAGFTSDLQELIVKPLQASVALVKSYPYLTRLYTTMSAEEMTVDPDFDFNRDAPDVSNLFTAKASFDSCESDWTKRRVRIELPDGRWWITSMGSGGGLTAGPNALRVEQYAEVGAPAVVVDNGKLVDDTLRRLGFGVAGCGCTSADAGVSMLALALVGVWSARRRRAG